VNAKRWRRDKFIELGDFPQGEKQPWDVSVPAEAPAGI